MITRHQNQVPATRSKLQPSKAVLANWDAGDEFCSIQKYPDEWKRVKNPLSYKCFLLICFSALIVNILFVVLFSKTDSIPKPITTSFRRKIQRKTERDTFQPHTFTKSMENAFIFVRDPTQFRLQVAYAKKNDGSGDPLYTEEDISVIVRSLYVMFGFLNMGLWSGSPAHAHFIGTASCLVKLNRPAHEVSLGLLHSMYLQEWDPERRIPTEHQCDRRNALVSLIGKKLETKLWRHTALAGNGPWQNCFSVHSKLLHYYKNNKHDELLKSVLKELSPYVSICDDIEEIISGDVSLSNNWKRRNVEHFQTLRKIAKILNEPQLVEWIGAAKDMTVLFSQPPPQLHKQLTPLDQFELFNPEVHIHNTQANPWEVERLKFLTATSRREQKLLKPYLPAKCVDLTCQMVEKSRELCDSVVEGVYNVSTYLEMFMKQSDLLSECEKSGNYASKW